MVTCLCDRATGAAITDDLGALSALRTVGFVDVTQPVKANAVIIATDQPPPASSIAALFSSAVAQTLSTQCSSPG